MLNKNLWHQNLSAFIYIIYDVPIAMFYYFYSSLQPMVNRCQPYHGKFINCYASTIKEPVSFKVSVPYEGYFSYQTSPQTHVWDLQA